MSVLPLSAQETELEPLYQELLTADEDTHADIADRISDVWSMSGSAAIDLLLRRGTDALEDGENAIAVEHLTAAIDHDRHFAEAYHARASAYYALGLVGPAIDDLRQVLVLEPRHFEAMFGFAIMLEELDRLQDAQEVYRRIQRIYPLNPVAVTGLERISIQLEGQSL